MFKFILSLILSLSFMVTSVSAQEENNVDPRIYGESYVVIDGDTNEVILGKNIDVKMYPASITKLITAILLAENKKPIDMLTFTQSAKQMPEYSVNLNYYPMNVGQELSADFIMKSILIFSANDMAQVVADNISKDLGMPFKDIMNNKLKELGIKNSNFTNAVGLHDDDHYSTAYDLAILLEKAMEYEWIRDVIGMKSVTVSLPDGSRIVYENSNKLLGMDGLIGGKTGYTSRAGRTLVGAFEYDGKTYIGTVLKSVYDADDSYVFQDMVNLIKSGRSKEKTLFYRALDHYPENVALTYKLFGFFGPTKTKEVPIILKEDVYLYDNDYNSENLKTELIVNNNVNIFTNSDKPIGVLKVSILDYEKTYNITANMSSIIMDNVYIYLISVFFIILILILIILLIRKIFKPKKNNRIWG